MIWLAGIYLACLVVGLMFIAGASIASNEE